MQAIEQNDLAAVKKMVKMGADVNETIVSSSPNYLFFISQRLYLDGLQKGMKGEYVYVTPLHASANRANIKVLKYLKKKKANIEAGDSEGKTPLMYALRNPGGEAYALTLLKKGANFRAVDAAGNTALHYAAFGGNMEGVKMVTGGGVDINVCNNDSITPFLAAAVFSSPEFLAELEIWEANCHARDKDGMGALHYAAAYGNREKLEWIFQRDASLNNLAQNGYTPMDIAQEAGNSEAVKFLKEKGGKYSHYRYQEMIAAIQGLQHQNLRQILEEGADPNRKDEEFPLILAIRNGDNVSTELLLKAGANPNITNNDGLSALEMALNSGHATVALALLKNGAKAEPEMISECLDQIMKLERPGYWVDVVKEMIENTNDLNINGGSMNMPALHYAAYIGQEEIVSALLKAGADANALDPEGWAPIHWAVMKRDLLRLHLEKLRIAEALLAAGANINQKSTAPKLLPHTGPYLAKRVPRAATAFDLLEYALPKDADLEELLSSKNATSGLSGEDFLENGKYLSEAKDFQAAQLEFNRALIANPKLAEAYFERAKAKSMLGLYTEVVRDLDMAISLQAIYPEAFLNRAKAQLELRKATQAESDVNMAIKQGYEKSEALYWRGKCKLRANNRSSACEDFQSSAALGNKDGAAAVKLYCH